MTAATRRPASGSSSGADSPGPIRRSASPSTSRAARSSRTGTATWGTGDIRRRSPWTPRPGRGADRRSASARTSAGGPGAGWTRCSRPDPLEDRAGGGAGSRWALEAAYGFPAIGGRWTGGPHAGLGLATGARDYELGWRLTPEAAGTPDLSFGVRATRRESDGTAPEHGVGVGITARW